MRYIHLTDPDDLVLAARYLERAVDINPGLADPYPYLTYVSVRQNRIDRAIEAGLTAVALQPDFAQAHYFLGAAYWFGTETEPGRCPQAPEEFATAVHLDPSYGAGWVTLAAAALQMGDYARAERVLNIC